MLNLGAQFTTSPINRGMEISIALPKVEYARRSEKYKIQFNDGTHSIVDKRVLDIISSLQNAKRPAHRMLGFYDIANLLGGTEDDLISFYHYVLQNWKISESQLYQDLFVTFILGEKKQGTFLEFGATNGVELSNSLLLEKNFGWKGVLVEPSPQWHQQLLRNRPDATIVTDCIYSETGKQIDFFVSDVGVLSSLQDFRNHDVTSMPGNAQARNNKGYNVQVPTISLNDVFVKYFDSKPIEYMSVDTEGSEFLILKNFDFEKFGPKIVSVEHNFTETEKHLDDLFQQNGYKRYFKEQTQFDAWYVRAK